MSTLYPLRQEIDMVPDFVSRILDNIRTVVVANPEVLDLALVSVLAEGHILIEDVPGIGKTTLAKTLARSLGGSFNRVQCTPDLLPSDVTGIHFFNQKKDEFEFRPGPITANVVLVDEINRATPRTQSSLLECMQERQVTVDGVTFPLPEPFMVIATQNPVELQGTFPLPEAQLDRFLLRMALGYPGVEDEDAMLLRFERHNPLEQLQPVTQAAEIVKAQQQTREVFVEPSLRRYILEIIQQTRHNPAIALGGSPRASLALYRATQALALINGRDFALPDDVKRLAVPVLGHRLILSTEAYLHNTIKEKLIADILSAVPVPAE
jgi:MoxR-like ATPase